MYHSSMSLFHLAFVLFTFLSTTRFSLVVSMYLMLPIYFCEFVVVYAMKIDAVNHWRLFQITKAIFLSKLEYPVLEQSLYFTNLAFFFLSASCLKLCFMAEDVGKLASSRDAMV